MNIKIILIVVLMNAYSAIAQDTDTVSIDYRKPLFDFNPQKAVFRFDKEQEPNINRLLRFSVLTGYRQGVAPVQGFANFTNYQNYENGTSRVYMYNLSIQDILTHGFYNSNKVILEVKNPSHYRYNQSQGSEEEWMRKNAYCFELLLPMGTINGVKILNDELARVFGVEFGLKKRMTNTLILVRTSKTDKLKASGKGEATYTRQGYLNNVTLDALGSVFYFAGFAPLVDETGYTKPVDMDLRITSKTNLESLRKSLRLYDLDLKEEKRVVEMFVITEIK